MKYSVDGGITWHDALEVRVSNHVGEDHFEVVTIFDEFNAYAMRMRVRVTN